MIESTTLTETLSPHLFWDVDRSVVDFEKHADFIIRRIMERGPREDVAAVWGYYRHDQIKDALTTAPALSRKTISFFAHQFALPMNAFRAHRNPPINWEH